MAKKVTQQKLIKSFEEDWNLKLKKENGKWYLWLNEFDLEEDAQWEELEHGLYDFMINYLEGSFYAGNKDEDEECLEMYNWYKENIEKLIEK